MNFKVCQQCPSPLAHHFTIIEQDDDKSKSLVLINAFTLFIFNMLLIAVRASLCAISEFFRDTRSSVDRLNSQRQIRVMEPFFLKELTLLHQVRRTKKQSSIRLRLFNCLYPHSKCLTQQPSASKEKLQFLGDHNCFRVLLFCGYFIKITKGL